MGTFIRLKLAFCSRDNSQINISFLYLCFSSKNKMEIQKVLHSLIADICYTRVDWVWFTDINDKYDILCKV